jgi:hypothetical protein
MAGDHEKEQLQRLHLTLEAALEQLGYALEAATAGAPMGSPTEDVQAVERLYGECTQLRNQVRERLMRVLARPRLDILK